MQKLWAYKKLGECIMTFDLGKLLSGLYDLREGFSRTPSDDDVLELKMPPAYRKIFRLVRHWIRSLLWATLFTGIIIGSVKLITGRWWAVGSFFYFILLPNFILSVIKQQMRIYAKRKFS